MKNKIASAVTIALMFAPGLVLADDCSVTNSCPVGNGNPALLMEPWGLTYQDSQKYLIPSGSSVVLANGVEQPCPWWFPQGCFDLRWFYKN